MQPTMKDVAALANVSIKTVSRVVNNEGELADGTRLRVQEAIRELDYKPNLVARGLVTQRSYMLGFIVPDICNPYFAEVSRGVQETAKQNGLHMVIANTDESLDEELEAVRSMDAQGIDGIVLFGALALAGRLHEVTRARRPLVVVNTEIQHQHAASVSADIYSCGKLAVEHLVTLGHKHIGMIAADAPDRGAMRRPRAYRDVLRAHGIPVRENYVMHVPPRLADGQNAAHALLLRNPEITALYCYNDLLAMGALRACADLGRRVPQDCALVGCDDIAYASACVPALTTVRTDKRLLGARAVQTLLGMIAAPGKPVENPVLNVELIVRETT